MRKTSAFITAGALALTFGSAVLGQALADGKTVSSVVATDHSMRTSKLIGMDIFNEQGAKIGKIQDILVKGTASEPVAVLSVGAFVGGGDKMVGVPLSHIMMKNDAPSMAATQAQLAAMPKWTFDGLSGGGG